MPIRMVGSTRATSKIYGKTRFRTSIGTQVLICSLLVGTDTCQKNSEENDFIFPITIHPDVSGWVPSFYFACLSNLDPCRFFVRRPHVLLMLERFIEWINTHSDVHWVPLLDMALEFASKNPPAPGAKLPVSSQH